MPIEKEYRGKVFQQIAPRLRWVRGENHLTVESFRPMNEETGQIIGPPPNISFDDDDDVDVGAWLARGRIAPSESGAKATAPLTDTEAHSAGRGKSQPAEPEAGG